MERKTKIANFIKGLIVIALAASIVVVLSKVLLLKSEDGVNQMQALYKQPENSIDVIFSGSSKVYCDIATGVLWDNYGISGFDLGGAEAPSWVSYYQLKEALKTQRPKVICYEVSVTAMFPQILTQSNNWASDNNYGMKWNSNRIEQLRANSEEKEFYPRLNPFNIMHGRYNDLSENDFTNVRDTVSYKGFDPRENIWEMNTPDMSGVTGQVPCSDKEVEYITKIIELARSEGIEILFFASPYDVSEDEQLILNYVESLAKENGVEYIDFNKRYDELGMDFSCDMADTGHLGYTGNYKFTDYFGSILKDKYSLADHRGDDRYASWETDALLQRYERNDLAIQSTEDASEILSLAGEGYTVFMVNEKAASVFDDNQIVASDGENFRLSMKLGDDSFVFSEKMDKGNRLISLFVNDTEYLEFYGNIMFVYDKVRHEFVRSIYF